MSKLPVIKSETTSLPVREYTQAPVCMCLISTYDVHIKAVEEIFVVRIYLIEIYLRYLRYEQ